MLWWGRWRAEPEVETKRVCPVQSLRCRHFIHEWNWQSADVSPHLSSPASTESTSSMFLTAALGQEGCFRVVPLRFCRRSAVFSNHWFEVCSETKPKPKAICNSHGHKTNISHLWCLFSSWIIKCFLSADVKYQWQLRRFEVSETFFSIFSPFNHNELAFPLLQNFRSITEMAAKTAATSKHPDVYLLSV